MFAILINFVDAIQQYVSMIMAGLVGNAHMISCTILALTKLIHDYKGSQLLFYFHTKRAFCQLNDYAPVIAWALACIDRLNLLVCVISKRNRKPRFNVWVTCYKKLSTIYKYHTPPLSDVNYYFAYFSLIHYWPWLVLWSDQKNWFIQPFI